MRISDWSSDVCSSDLSDFLLRQMAIPGFHVLFQLMIFAALLESGVGAIHAINERVSGVVEARGRPPLGTGARALLGAAILAGCMFVAGKIGLVEDRKSTRLNSSH